MSVDQPGVYLILPLARKALIERVAPALSGEAKLEALMAAKAIELALNEAAEGAAAQGAIDAALFGQTPADRTTAERALARAIRNGLHDQDQAVRAGLIAAARARLDLWNPKLAAALSAADAFHAE